MEDKWLAGPAAVVARVVEDAEAHSKSCRDGWRGGIPCIMCNREAYDNYMAEDAMGRDAMRYYHNNPHGNWSGD